MVDYFAFNLNPKGRKTGDCSTRALAGTLGISYVDALKLQYEAQLELFYDWTSKQVMEHILSNFGYIKMKQPRKASGKKYTVSDMDKLLTKKQMQEGVLIFISNHLTCIVEGVLQDIWDCREHTVLNYFVKGETK